MRRRLYRCTTNEDTASDTASGAMIIPYEVGDEDASSVAMSELPP